MAPVEEGSAPGREAYRGRAYSRCWARTLLEEEDAAGGGSW